jgi:peptide/nickel transport system permease protein
MIRFLLRKVGAAVLVLFGVSIVVFLLARVIPGDPARIALGPRASAQQVQSLRHELYLDKPLVTQYLYFLGGVVRGDLGTSLYSKRPVTDDLRQYFPATLELVLFAGLLMLVVGIPLGILAARHRDRVLDHTSRIVALLGVVTPAFVWAIVLMLIFCYWIGTFPIEGTLSDGVSPPTQITGMYLFDAIVTGNWPVAWDAFQHIVLPAVALSLAGIGQAARIMRTSMVETYQKPYIELARAFGLSERIIARKYALRPSLIPTITVMGLDFAATLGNAFLVESESHAMGFRPF